MVPSCTNSRIQCQRTAMCFVLLWSCGFRAIAMRWSRRYPPQIFVGMSSRSNPSSVYRFRSQMLPALPLIAQRTWLELMIAHLIFVSFSIYGAHSCHEYVACGGSSIILRPHWCRRHRRILTGSRLYLVTHSEASGSNSLTTLALAACCG